MSNSLLEMIGIDPAYYIIGLLAFVIILLVVLLVQGSKIRKLSGRLDAFMSGEKTDSLENEIKIRFAELDSLKQVSLNHTESLKEVGEFLKVTYSKIGIVKYDAFREMGGNLSFALCLLNEKNDGMLLNAMHSREGCYTYIKEIINGESYIELSEEEQEALSNAINVRNYMDK
jgi:hypothetical protein